MARFNSDALASHSLNILSPSDLPRAASLSGSSPTWPDRRLYLRRDLYAFASVRPVSPACAPIQACVLFVACPTLLGLHRRF